MTADHREPESGLDRGDLLRLGGLLVALLAIVGLVLLLGGGGGGSERSTGRMQGVLTTVEDTRLVLQPTDGTAPQEFAIRPEDRRRLDMFHLQQHAADQLQSIVHYVQEGGQRYATRVDDAPT